MTPKTFIDPIPAFRRAYRCLFWTALALGAALLLLGCATGNQAVPSTRLRWNAATGQLDATLPKDETIRGLRLERTGTNVLLTIQSVEARNEADIVSASWSGLATAQAQQMQAAMSALESSLSLAGAALRASPPQTNPPPPAKR